jgi:hypothetical protein
MASLATKSNIVAALAVASAEYFLFSQDIQSAAILGGVTIGAQLAVQAIGRNKSVRKELIGKDGKPIIPLSVELAIVDLGAPALAAQYLLGRSWRDGIVSGAIGVAAHHLHIASML